MTRELGCARYWTAREQRYAVPAFNVSNLETIQGVLAAAEAALAPVVLQVSPGAIAYAGYPTLTRLAFDLADASPVPVVVHLDHCRDPRVVERAIEDGYGSVMFDGSALPLEQNIAITASLVATARAADAGIAVEAEIGRIGGPEDTDPAAAWATRTTPAEVAAFVAATRVDVLAPNLGNLHRMPDDSIRLDPAHVESLAIAADRPLALHGGSGVVRDQLDELARAGVTKVNVSSRVTRALAHGIRQVWAADPAQLDLRRYLGAGRDAIVAMARPYFDATGAAGRAAVRDSGAWDRPATVAIGATAWSSTDAEPE